MQLHRGTIGWLGFALWGSLCLAVREAPSAERRYNIEEIRQAWMARQTAVRTVRVTWSEEWLIPARSRLRIDVRNRRKKPEEVPDRDLTFQSKVEISLNGKMLRYVYDGPYWHGLDGELRQHTYITTFDGETSQSSFVPKPPHPEGIPPAGFINREARHSERDNHRLRPVLMALRPCDPETGGLDFNQWVISERDGAIGGTRCVIIAPSVARDDHDRYWLDPGRDFIVMRVERLRADGRNVSMQDITHQRDRMQGWMPSAWKYTFQGGSNSVKEQVAATVTKCEFDIDLPRSEFQIAFAPGMLVRNLKTKDDYIQRENEGKRAITKAEIARGAKYEEFLRTDAGMAGLKHRTWTVWLLGAATVVLSGLAVVLALRSRARRAAAGGPQR